MPQLRLRTLSTLGAVGFATGIVTLLFHPFGGVLYREIEEAVDALAIDWLETVIEFVMVLGPGTLFGLGVALVAHRMIARSAWHWLLFAAAGTASWYLGILTALEFLDVVDEKWLGLATGGGAGGVVGAAVMAAAALIAYTPARTWRRVAAVVAVGGLAGTLLAAQWNEEFWILFPVWQTAVAVALGWAAAADGKAAA